MTPSPKRSLALRLTGLLLLSIAFLVRPGVVGHNLTPDGVLNDEKKILAIFGCEILAGLLGLWFLLLPPRSFLPRARTLLNAVLTAAVGLAIVGNVRLPREEFQLDGPSLRNQRRTGLAAALFGELEITDEQRREGEEHGLNSAELVGDPARHPVTSPQRAELEAAVWPEEVFALELTADQLLTLRRLVLGELGADALQLVFTDTARLAPPEIPCATPRPVTLDVTSRSWTPPQDPASLDPQEWWEALDRWRLGFARMRWSNLVPEDVEFTDGVAYVELGWQVNVELESGGLRHYRGTWSSEWIPGQPTGEARPTSSQGWKCRNLQPRAGATLEAAAVAFVDVTLEALAGTGMSPLLPRAPEPKEHYRGVVLVDVDADDDLDIVTSIPNTLLLNDGEGRFEDVTEKAGIAREMGFAGVQAADFDRDGDVDLVFCGKRREALLYRQGPAGKFEPVPISGSRNDNHPSSLTAHDVDKDGWLDLLICGYGPLVNPGPDRPYDATNARSNQMMAGGPDGFRDVTVEWGLGTESSRWSFIGTFGDADEDGDEDLYMANDFGPNVLYRRVRETPPLFEPEVEPLESFDASFSMSATWVDLDGDTDLDMYVSNMESYEVRRIERLPGHVDGDPRDRELREIMGNGNAVLLQEQAGEGRALVETSTSRGARDAKWAWGTAVFDWDLDGDLDIQCVNGFRSMGLDDARDWDSVWWRYAAGDMQRHPELWKESLARHYPANAQSGWSWDGFQRSVFYLNDGQAHFSQIAPVLGLDQVLDGRALAMGDIDRDGDVDLVGGSVNAPHLYVLRNDTRTDRHFAWIALVPSDRRSPVGSRILLTAGGKTQRRDVILSEGFVSQHDTAKHFGLEDAQTIERVEVRWPDGEVAVWDELPVDRRILLRQGGEVWEEQPLRLPNENATGRLGPVEWANDPDVIELVTERIEAPVRLAVTPSPFEGQEDSDTLRAVVLWDPRGDRTGETSARLLQLARLSDLEIVLVAPESTPADELPDDPSIARAAFTGEGERNALLHSLSPWCGVRDLPYPIVLYCARGRVLAISRGAIVPDRVRVLLESYRES